MGKKLPWIILIFGVGGFLIAVPMALGGFEYFNGLIIAFATRIVEGTPTWSMWQKIPIPVYLRIRIFNVTNPSQVAEGAKPVLAELGPYVYMESLEKFDITVNSGEDSVRYRQVRYYYFQPGLSGGKESDKITFLNLAYVGVARLAHDFTDVDYLLNTLDEMLIEKGEKLFRTHTVRQLLFDGFSVQNFLDLANDPLVQNAGEITIPDQLQSGKMGILKGKNGTDDGWYVVRTGRDTSANFGRVVSWNGMSVLKKYGGDSCNTVNGTDGILYQPFLTDDTVLQAFIPDLCRSLTFQKDGLATHYGISCFRYRISDFIFQGVEKNPDNWCFCPSPANLSLCNTDGVVSLAGCFGGAPLYLSNPHFYNGDKKLLEDVQGLNPNREDHFGYIDLHPLTGVSIEVRQRIQFNIELTAWEAMPTFQNVPNAIVPILWAEEGGDIDSFTKTLIKLMDIGIKLWNIFKWLIIIFQLLVSAAGFGLIYQQKKSSKVELLEPAEDDDELSLDDKASRASSAVSEKY